jgi:magnesium-transporting ATPase (P-type)
MLTFDQLRAKHGAVFDTERPQLSKGLTESEAAVKLLANGPNVITPAKTQSSLQLFLHCLTNKFSLLLIFCAILTLILLSLPNSDIRNVP